MKKIKRWFYDHFLPTWAKESLLADYKRLERENEQLLLKLAEKDAYIAGLAAGMKAQRRIVINNGEGKQ